MARFFDRAIILFQNIFEEHKTNLKVESPESLKHFALSPSRIAVARTRWIRSPNKREVPPVLVGQWIILSRRTFSFTSLAFTVEREDGKRAGEKATVWQTFLSLRNRSRVAVKSSFRGTVLLHREITSHLSRATLCLHSSRIMRRIERNFRSDVHAWLCGNYPEWHRVLASLVARNEKHLSASRSKLPNTFVYRSAVIRRCCYPW